MNYSEPELNAAFKRVQTADDWRAPINRIIRDPGSAELDKIREAVMFYTATTATVWRGTLPVGLVQITAPGYRQGPAGP